MAHRGYPITDLHIVHQRELKRSRVLYNHLHQRQIPWHMGLDDLPHKASSIEQDDFDLLEVVDHMGVGQDIALRGDEESRAQPLSGK